MASITFTDGGDNSSIQVGGTQVTLTSELPPVHVPGKIIRVQPLENSDSFYYRADAAIAGIAGLQKVVWQECSGDRIALDLHLMVGIVRSDGVFVLAGSLTDMNSVMGSSFTYEESTCGDTSSVAVPEVTGKSISVMLTFQDRLVVSAGGSLLCSRTTDYFRFFRRSLQTLTADDAFELASLASENDVIYHAVPYGKGMMLVGRSQYLISGDTVFSALNKQLPAIANYPGLTSTRPVGVGSRLVAARTDGISTTVHEITPGALSDTPESHDLTAHLRRYLAGSPVEFEFAEKPTSVFLRTSGFQRGLFLYSYLDTADGRKQSAWLKLLYDCVAVCGMAMSSLGSLILFCVRVVDGSIALVADEQPLVPGSIREPHIDSWRAYSVGTTLPVGAYSGGTYDLYGGAPATLAARYGAEGMRVGLAQDAYVTLTNPFPKDYLDRPDLSIRRIVSTVTAELFESGGMAADLVVDGVLGASDVYPGRVVGQAVIGQVPNYTGEIVIPVAAEVRSYLLTIRALQWLPLEITAVGWVGQQTRGTRRV